MNSKFGTVVKDSISEQIATRLLSLLKEKHLKPGDKLPPERELAALMQVSRSSLREALRALSMMNVLEIRQGSGTYVSSLDSELLAERLSFIFSVKDSAVTELFEARKILEAGIAGLAAQRVAAEDIEALKLCLAASKEAVDNPDAFLKADLALHKKITEIARNSVLTSMYDSISQLNLASRSRTNEIPGLREQSHKDHQQIVTALETRDAQAAQQAMLQHLNNVEQKFKTLIDAN